MYIEKAEEEQAVQEGRDAWQKYPVLYLDFNTENYNNEHSMHTILHTHLVQWEKQYGADTSEQTFSSRFKGIIQRAYQKTGKQVAILVGEYDKPLLQTMGVNEELNEKYRNELKVFYSVIKTCDEYIRFAFLTGVTNLVNFLKEAHYYIPDLDGKVELDEEGLQPYRAVAADVLPILFQAGYLTIKTYIQEARMYRLGFPNNEVRYGFLKNVLPAYSGLPFVETGKSVWKFVEDIRAGNVEGVMERLKSIIAGIAYDNFTEENLKLREQNYQTAVYLVFTLMGQFVQTEVHCYSTAMESGGSTQ